MTVFKKNISENTLERKLVGANVPLPTYSLLTLYCIANGTSKSGVITDILSEWEKEVYLDTTLDAIVTKVVAMAVGSFGTAKATSKEVFTRLLELDLKKRGVLDSTISNILIQFDNATK